MKKVYLLLIAFVLLISCGGQKTDDAKNAAATDGEQISKTFEGDFVYYADSANFSNYTEMKTYPVAMEGEYINLEREYTGFRSFYKRMQRGYSRASTKTYSYNKKEDTPTQKTPFI